jgi:hypothetical protein
MSAALTMIMFAGGLINSVLSLLTFKSIELRKVGCGIYLLSSSVTSLLTISMLTVKFWFIVLTQINASVNLSVLRRGCVSVEPLLKFFVYLDTWLNACVAVERAIHVSKGVKFNKEKSKRIARWIITILPLFVMTTIIHEPIHRNLLEYTTEKYKSKQYENWTNESMEYETGKKNSEKYETAKEELQKYETANNESKNYETENHVLCVINYSRSVQDYNTVILFFHLIAPFVANLFSALYIIFGSARQRSVARTHQTYKEHVLEQLSEHKQLLISPVVLLILSLPRLVISLVSGCVNASNNPWLYLCGYFISFTPSMLMFVVFVFPSKLYMKTFKESLLIW